MVLVNVNTPWPSFQAATTLRPAAAIETPDWTAPGTSCERSLTGMLGNGLTTPGGALRCGPGSAPVSGPAGELAASGSARRLSAAALSLATSESPLGAPACVGCGLHAATRAASRNPIHAQSRRPGRVI